MLKQLIGCMWCIWTTVVITSRASTISSRVVFSNDHTDGTVEYEIVNTTTQASNSLDHTDQQQPYGGVTIESVSNDTTLDCSVMSEYGSWNFDFRYRREEIARLFCKCMFICKKVTLEEDIRTEVLTRDTYVLSAKNKPKFVAVITVFSLLFVIGTTGNLTTIIGLLRWMKNRTPTFAFIVSLSCSDLLMLWICMPIKVTEYFHLGDVFNVYTCKISCYLRDFALICSVLTLTVISFERYYAICRPLEVQYRCTWARARKIICTVWLISAILAAPTAVVTQLYMPISAIFMECLAQSHDMLYLKLYYIYYLGVMFLLPTVIMTFTYGRSCQSLWRSTLVTKKLQGGKRDTYVKAGSHGAQSKPVSKGTDDVASRRRVIKVLISIVVGFIVCWGPHLIVQLLCVIDVLRAYRAEARLLGESMTYFSSALNPYLFMAMSSQFCPGSIPCLRFLRRRSELSAATSKGSTMSMNTNTTSGVQSTEDNAV